jgi:hypothetical protein
VSFLLIGAIDRRFMLDPALYGAATLIALVSSHSQRC